MALFQGNKEQSQTEQSMNESFFDEMAGAGLENFTPESVSAAYLSMVQPGSGPTAEGVAPGQWRNSATGNVYGPQVTVIPMAFKTVWTERDANPPYLTVGRYEPNSIPVQVKRPKPGARGFPEMFNPETGNKIQELFIYAVMLADHPDAGVLYFSPTVGSMKACKQWNTYIRSCRLPSGKQAPIFAFSWDLQLELVQNPAKPSNPNEKIAKFVKATRNKIVTLDLFQSYVQPAISTANNIALLAAPEASGDTE